MLENQNTKTYQLEESYMKDKKFTRNVAKIIINKPKEGRKIDQRGTITTFVYCRKHWE